ncbi:cupin domain-containing protein [Cupriavidus sp. CV2]|uniref:cupin domain-containing protein n=1 Tax=Cupriavidus ulmosensis TaxID=3065913 RepID=UPI00296B0449|nr:cupin domain-containing protein [Cupriavidus sp. CV2]MDW3685997.1 cupin domain-containing protein [Cupriavidus sp. CV2]
MSETFHFLDVSDQPPREQVLWPSILVPQEAIGAEIERLAEMAMPSSGRRSAAVVHPFSEPQYPAFAPGIDVTIHVLKPGEETPPIARNSSAVDMCIAGAGVARVGGKTFALEQFDVWNTPSMMPASYRNEGKDLFVRLSYSNAPLLERLEVHYVDEHPILISSATAAPQPPSSARARDRAEAIDIGTDGARLLGYEYLVDIDMIESRPLLWPWKEVNKHLRNVYERDVKYTGRHLYVLYNPATGRRIGTTPSFFASIAHYPPGKVDRPHRHSSAAINYYFQGHGKSQVMGQRMEWKAGDLHLSAPGWAVHNHASREQGFCALTIQDHPLHIAMDSLLWQEELKGPIAKLGTQSGFQTNIETYVAS